MTAIGCEVSFGGGGDRKYSKTDDGDGCTTLDILKMMYTHKRINCMVCESELNEAA